MADARLKAVNIFGEAEVSRQPTILGKHQSRAQGNGRLEESASLSRAQQKASCKMKKRILELDRQGSREHGVEEQGGRRARGLWMGTVLQATRQ